MARKKKRKKTAGDIFLSLVIVVALCVLCYSGFRLLSIYMEYKKGTDEYSALEELAGEELDPDQGETEGMGQVEVEENGQAVTITVPTMKNPIDFAELKAKNDEVIGWIKIPAIDVSYPICQAVDNDYYLHNTFEKEANIAGCIFLDYLSRKNFQDQNSLVYGHNMKNGSMFGTLKKFYEDGVYEKSPYFWIYTPDKIFKYEIFSCAEVGATSDTYTLIFPKDEDFVRYIDEAKQRSVVDSDVDVRPGDKIVTLSTCTGNEATRFVVQGKMIQTYKAE